ncbi:MAG: hypothetical protein JW738_06875 [Actinobacteria bacterium]|nr:hypothetical protein [Actinomycetota bacterium]
MSAVGDLKGIKGKAGAFMERDLKTVSAAVIAVIFFLGGITTIVVTAASINRMPNIFGTYIGENGVEMTFKEDGTYINIAAPIYLTGCNSREGHYSIIDNSIRIGLQEYRIEDDGTLVGGGAAWVKQKKEPDRPSDLAGTYVSGHELMISLDKSGAAYFQKVSPDSSERAIWVEIWAAENGKIKMTAPDYSTNNPETTFLNMNGTNLSYENTVLSKYSDKVIIPVGI